MTLLHRSSDSTLRYLILPLTIAFLSMTACSSMSSKSQDVTIGPDGTPITAQEKKSIQDTPATSNDISDSGSDLAVVPLAVNRAVFQWIDYFQGQGRPHMERYLSRSTRYMPIMQDILKKEGLPKDLIYIALIESGFASSAHSTASAVGYWQFIKGTGKRYGMQIDSFVDERRDFVRSTQGAAEYFKGLYNLFGSWYLAIASYNVGENRIKNLVMKNKTRDFWQLARENRLPEETANYVPKFLAARLIAREPEKYGFTDIDYLPPLDFSEVEFKTGIDIRKLAKEMNVEYDDLRDLNPSYKRGVAFAKNGSLKLRVPKGTEALALASADKAEAEARGRYVADADYSYYRVRRGDNLATIAKKFNSTQAEIRELNKMGRHASIVAGRRIRVPAETVAGLSKSDISASKKKSMGDSTRRNNQADSLIQVVKSPIPRATRLLTRTEARNQQRVHVVRRGENLMSIARLYRVSLRQLAKHNDLRNRSQIMVGSRLEIP